MSPVDQVGYWTELKLEIVRDYASAYSTIMSNQTDPALEHFYVDAFAGPGVNISKATGQLIPGSPTNALNVSPPFCEYHLIDADGDKLDMLEDSLRGRTDRDVTTYSGDCNEILIEKVFPLVPYNRYRRALCLLDPYNIDLDWQVMSAAGEMRSVEIFLNFMVMDINRGVLRRNPELIDPQQAERLTRFWGDGSWRDAAYTTQGRLFDDMPGKTGNDALADAFRKRLRDVAGFRYVPEPLPMRNSKNAVLYYLFFASPNAVGSKIVEQIFKKYRDRGAD
ncbi:three-Cys-motif partner protein TcmP [bacterium]|nr:three-Cys-motif partner protein TcmP [bacterium]